MEIKVLGLELDWHAEQLLLKLETKWEGKAYKFSYDCMAGDIEHECSDDMPYHLSKKLREEAKHEIYEWVNWYLRSRLVDFATSLGEKHHDAIIAV